MAHLNFRSIDGVTYDWSEHQAAANGLLQGGQHQGDKAEGKM